MALLKEAILNINRRRVRTFLTVLGISIGIIALTVMGSLSEFINRMVQVTLEDARGIVQVNPKFAFGPPGRLRISLILSMLFHSFWSRRRLYGDSVRRPEPPAEAS